MNYAENLVYESLRTGEPVYAKCSLKLMKALADHDESVQERISGCFMQYTGESDNGQTWCVYLTDTDEALV